MRKTVFLICFLLLFMTCCFEDCKSPTSTSPDLEELYSFTVEYHRPQIVYPFGFDPNMFGFWIAYRPDGIYSEAGQRYLTKITEDLFIGDFDNIPCSLKYDKVRIVDFIVHDPKRNSLPFAGFGDVIVLVNKKTGATYRLTKVIKNPYPPYTEGSTIARCHILHDGSVTSEVQ